MKVEDMGHIIAEAERIKDRLRACTSAKQVHDVANQEREAYQNLKDGKGLCPTFAIQIRNLKAYMLKVALKD